jgi:predicted DNA-binding transcriptional regulator AlpA
MGEVVDLSAARAKRQPEPWISKREAAEHIGVVPRTVTTYMKAGLPFSKAFERGPARFKRSEVDEWLKGRAA